MNGYIVIYNFTKRVNLEKTYLICCSANIIVCILIYCVQCYQLYKGTDDYELLCSAEQLENQITSPDSTVSSSDLATLCRLSKIRSQDEEILVHIIRSLTHVISNIGLFPESGLIYTARIWGSFYRCLIC